MERIVPNKEKIIQIKLFENEMLETKKFVRFIGISLGIALLVFIVTYYFLDIRHLFIHLSLLTIALSAIAAQLFNDFFLQFDTILIIAFGEFQLMRKNQILCCEKIKNLDFKNRASTVTIKGLYTSDILIGFGNAHQDRKVSRFHDNIVYVIYSKLDWQILLKHST